MKTPDTLDPRFREAAEREGLVDVAFDVAESPVGDLLVAVTERGLAASPTGRTRRSTSSPPTSAPECSAVPAAPTPSAASSTSTSPARAGASTSRPTSPLPVFHRQVLRELARVPFGEVTTYGALAARVGKPSAARAIGGAMNRNPIPIVLPCHRVIGSNGSLTGYAGGLDRKVQLLRLEGVTL